MRPVLQRGRLTTDVLAGRGGPFSLGAIVDIGDPTPRPSAPEVEDRVFDPARTQQLAIVGAPEFWNLLENLAFGTLREVFGASLEPDGRTASMPLNTGDASLGVIRPGARPILDESFGKLRIRLSDPDLGPITVPVTDIRLYDPDSGEVDDQCVALVRDRLRRRELLLSVGLSRPWTREAGKPARHWLQVNNIHLDDNPLWPS